MDRKFLTDNINDPSTLIKAIISEHQSNFDEQDYKLYDVANHDTLDSAKRPDKMIMKPTGVLGSDGKPRMQLATVKLNRIAVPMQKLIVTRAVAFLAGGKVTLDSNPNGAVETALDAMVKQNWKDNKLQYKNQMIAEMVMSQTECAEIWYSRVDEEKNISLRCNLYAPADGYELFPVFDSNRDMIAFGMRYQSADRKKKYFDLYTDKELRRHVEAGSDWSIAQNDDLKDEVLPLNYGKIPVVYYSQQESAWKMVQGMIDRLETLLSNFGDTNDYNGSPILFASGGINGFAQKGESGKLIEGENGADLKYVTWEHAPESIKLEIETLIDFIYTCTQTPNISFKQMQGLGDISGVMFDRILIDAHLKAMNSQQGYFGECIQRRLNFLLAANIKIEPTLKTAKSLDITPVFGLFKIDDEADRIANAMAANGGKPVIDHESSIAMAALTDDPQKTFKDIHKQQEADAAAALALVEKNNPTNDKP